MTGEIINSIYMNLTEVMIKLMKLESTTYSNERFSSWNKFIQHVFWNLGGGCENVKMEVMDWNIWWFVESQPVKEKHVSEWVSDLIVQPSKPEEREKKERKKEWQHVSSTSRWSYQWLLVPAALLHPSSPFLSLLNTGINIVNSKGKKRNQLLQHGREKEKQSSLFRAGNQWQKLLSWAVPAGGLDADQHRKWGKKK